MVFQNSTSISVLSTRVVIFSILLPQDMCQVYQVFFHLLCWFLFWTFQLVTAFMLKSGSNVIFTIQLGDHWMIMSSINVTLTLVLDAFFDIWPNFLMNFNWHLHLNVSSFMLQWQIWNLIKKTLKILTKKFYGIETLENAWTFFGGCFNLRFWKSGKPLIKGNFGAHWLIDWSSKLLPRQVHNKSSVHSCCIHVIWMMHLFSTFWVPG